MEAQVLEYFLRVAELGSINRAAAELRLSQPSLSRWLALLEHEVGTPLLIRSPQGVRTTDAGGILADRVRPILRQLNLLREEVGQRASAQVALGMPSAMQQLVTVPFAMQIAQEHPHMTMRIYEGINNTIRRWMEQGVLDTAILVQTEHVPETFHSRPLIRERLLLVGGCSSGLSVDRPVPLARLANVPLILPGPPNVIRAQVENALRKSGHKYCSRMEVETPTLCMELARRGLGYTVMPACAVHDGSRDNQTGFAPIRGLGVLWSLHVNRARQHSVAVRALTSALREFVARQISSGKWPFATLATGNSVTGRSTRIE